GYYIWDDGVGMDADHLMNAFALGAERQYTKGSLGKFGLGLKTAGLSLASKLIIVSKAEKTDKPLCGILSLSEIGKQYEIDFGEAEGEYLNVWQKFADSSKHGTLLILRELTDNRPSYTPFVRYFSRYCSNVYHMFLEDPKHSLKIRIQDDL